MLIKQVKYGGILTVRWSVGTCICFTEPSQPAKANVFAVFLSRVFRLVTARDEIPKRTRFL